MNFYSPTHYRSEIMAAESEALGETGHRMKNCIEDVEACCYTHREHTNIMSMAELTWI